MSFSLIVIFTSMLIYCNVQAQRSPYAGSRPASGYKDTYLPPGTGAVSGSGGSGGGAVGNTEIGNRDGESGSFGSTFTSTSTDRLPYDAHGDAFIVNHYNSLPVDQRPFWIVNQQHIEAQRGTPSRPPARPPTQTGSTTQMTPNRQEIVDRFNDNTQQPSFPQQQFPQARPPQLSPSPPPPQQQSQQPVNTANNQNNVISLPDVVYPSNTTPEQRLDMEIQFLQDRLNALLERRRQLQAQNQGQQPIQTMPNRQNAQTTN